MKFHSLVSKILYLAKRTKPECLTAISFLTTRVTKCTCDDEEKLQRLVRYIRHSRTRGMLLSPGKTGITIRMFVDAAYGASTASGQGVTHRELRSDRRQGCSTLQVDQAILHVHVDH